MRMSVSKNLMICYLTWFAATIAYVTSRHRLVWSVWTTTTTVETGTTAAASTAVTYFLSAVYFIQNADRVGRVVC